MDGVIDKSLNTANKDIWREMWRKKTNGLAGAQKLLDALRHLHDEWIFKCKQMLVPYEVY